MRTRKLFFTSLMLLSTFLVSAQGNNPNKDDLIDGSPDNPVNNGRPGPVNPNQGQGPDKQVPFDAGLSVLIGAGVAYGAKRAYKKKNK